ncbi:MAG: acyl-CoA thioesterase [Ferruginibacter sp.]
MPAVFKQIITVEEKHIDQLGHVNNLVYLQWASAVSKMHWEQLADEAMRAPLLWVMGRQEIDYLKELKLAQQVRIETWVAQCEKQKCFRHILFYDDGRNELAAKALITWVLLDAATKKPMRISTGLVQLFEAGS